MVDLNRRTVPEALGTKYAAGIDFENSEVMPSQELAKKIVDSQIEYLGCVARERLDSYEKKSKWNVPSYKDVDDI
ncbi:MAG: hypothetical protein HN368_21805 [Spirochaetales bacterium]|nr:hypothetical protein [Spirochaetales bacterium]